MHGREGEERKRRRHMWPVPAPATAASVSAASRPPVELPESPSSESASPRSSCDSFLKDGHKIRVGDCALFQAGNAPPFIGIIRWFKAGEEDYLNLCVNWLYRPADIKLAKGVLLEAAPNEIFYSFHKDVISAASLLHPCKVAFLRKGVELPAGIPSFVCRRVYDITNKCLWWLTDQDYINERQEEVDQLLDKTRIEMHTVVQSGGRSPKPLNGPTSTQQLKSGSESVHNTGSSLPSQSKGKRKEKCDQSTEPIKRERFSKPDDGESINFKSDNMIKAEIVKITDKGGLVSSEGVEKLVTLMQLDKTEKKVDVPGRILIADVIAATDRYDCLSKFVQLRGLLILDEWLQEVHKSKTSDGSSPKDSDKTVDELLLALLRALAKLPVNLNALQTCNIGKSVNNLRGHKNLEIQKKARSLIDTWKKRVDAEMTKITDAKSVASSQPVWQAKPGSSDVSHSANRRAGSTELAAKNPVTQTASSKSLSAKPGHSDVIVKSASVIQGSLKIGSNVATSVTGGMKDPLCKAAANIGNADTQGTTVKEEKSSSSSQSQNNSQTYSGDHAKTVGASLKEETRNSSAASNAVKASGSSRHRRYGNGVSGTSISGVPKETLLDHGNNHRLIVKLPNAVRSPARSASGACFDDPSVSGSRASSPGISDKHEPGHSDRKVKVRCDAYRFNNAPDANTELWQSNDVKPPVGAGGVRSPTADEQQIRSSEETGKIAEAARAAGSSFGNEEVLLSESRMRNSFSSINALIESCVKYSEDNTPLAVEDDMGMNLLASVATGEISKSDLISPTGSPGASTAIEDPSTEAKSRLSSDDGLTQSQKARLADHDAAQGRVEPCETVDVNFKKQMKSIDSIISKDSYQDGSNFPGDNATMRTLLDNKLSGEQGERSPAAVSSHKSEDSCAKSEPKLEEEKDGTFSGFKPATMDKQDSDRASPLEEKLITGGQALDHYTDCKLKERSSSADESKPVLFAHQKTDENVHSSEAACRDGYGLDIAASFSESERLVVEESQLCTTAKVVPEVSTSPEQQRHLMLVEGSSKVVISSGAPDVSYPTNHDETSMPDSPEGSKLVLKDIKDLTSNTSNLDESIRQPTSSPGSAGVVEDSKMEAPESSPGLASQIPAPSCMAKDTEHPSKPASSRLSGAAEGVREDLATSADTAITAEPNSSSKLDFDLNEGITGDDGNHDEIADSLATVCSPIDLPSLSPFANSMSNGSHALITVAAAAKGPFVPRENLLKSKGEAGWKGSAATSAFRPAEPRKLLEMPLNIPDMPSSDSTGKQCRLPLDIDLNEPDDRVLEDMTIHSSSKTAGFELEKVSNLDMPPRISGGLDFDLNRVNEDIENGQFLASTSRRPEVPLLAVGPASIEFPNREANMLRDFDLNNGPGLDEVSAEPLTRSQNTKNNTGVPFLFPVASVRMNTAEMGNVSSWFPPGSSYPAVAIPSFLSNREQPYPIVAAPGAQRILGPVTATGPFGGDVYRSPVLSSSPPMAFTPTAFSYGGFTYGSNFPLAAASLSGGSTNFVDSTGAGSGFPAIPSPLVGPAGTVLSNFRRPHVVSLPEGSTSGGSESSRKWITPSLDLNAGPGNADVEGKDERLPLASRQLLVATSQGFAEDQMRMYTVPGGSLKRKEPEGGWDTERSSYKQISWQ
ncbi:hypothetical protein Cni_G02814 [Canna indica]|uniref:Uncharacterized protein n=1 Tax=Canna indica TaxID=4628 RepID=A0AAQ3JRZ0_9LILI|nr:hypothetical protein Cni_G02814 [Canna indica]